MKRLKEIKNQAYILSESVKRCNKDLGDVYEASFIEGAKWADKNMIDKACKVFQEMLVELCPELLGYGAIAVGWENEFRKRLEE